MPASPYGRARVSAPAKPASEQKETRLQTESCQPSPRAELHSPMKPKGAQTMKTHVCHAFIALALMASLHRAVAQGTAFLEKGGSIVAGRLGMVAAGIGNGRSSLRRSLPEAGA